MVKLDTDEMVLVEVQVNNEYDYFHRMIFGTSKIISEYMKSGQTYSNIKKVYSVNILYFDLGHGIDYVYHGTTSFTGIHYNDQLNLSDKQKQLYQKESVYHIYPEYYLIRVNQFNDVAKNTLDEWIYFLKNEEIKEEFHAKGLLEAKEKLDSFKLSGTEKQEYDKYIENTRYRLSLVESNFNAGKLEGKVEGEATGMIKGKLEVAKTMERAGMNKDIIQQLTGLSMDELNKLFTS